MILQKAMALLPLMRVKTILFMLWVEGYLKNKGVGPGQKVSFDVDYDHKGDKAVNVKIG